MTAPFATAGDFLARPFRPLTAEERAGLDVVLADASDDLRAEIGWQVYPQAVVTVTDHSGRGRVRLPGKPIAEVLQVTADTGDRPAGSWRLVDDVVHAPSTCGGPVSVTYRVGYAAPPAELVRWTCVIAAQRLATGALLADTGGVVPASMGVDDFRIAFSPAQQSGELPVPARVLQRLRATYGHTVHVT